MMSAILDKAGLETKALRVYAQKVVPSNGKVSSRKFATIMMPYDPTKENVNVNAQTQVRHYDVNSEQLKLLKLESNAAVYQVLRNKQVSIVKQ